MAEFGMESQMPKGQEDSRPELGLSLHQLPLRNTALTLSGGAWLLREADRHKEAEEASEYGAFLGDLALLGANEMPSPPWAQYCGLLRARNNSESVELRSFSGYAVVRHQLDKAMEALFEMYEKGTISYAEYVNDFLKAHPGLVECGSTQLSVVSIECTVDQFDQQSPPLAPPTKMTLHLSNGSSVNCEEVFDDIFVSFDALPAACQEIIQSEM